MEWKQGTPLREDQTPHAVLWHCDLRTLGYGGLTGELPADFFSMLWGDDKRSRRLTTFGHADPRDRASPHFLATRGGTPMHTDPGYTRFALQLQVHNQGFIVHGLEDDITVLPLFNPGLVILLDTWSPHKVSTDPRLPQLGPNKLLVGADYVARPDVAVELPRLVAHLRGGIRR